MNSEDVTKCPKCGESVFAIIDPAIRFCQYCGYELPISWRFESAMVDAEIEERQGRTFGTVRLYCDESDHFEQIIEEQIVAKECGYVPHGVKFCLYCGKGLPEELPPEWQERLRKEISELEIEEGCP